MSVIGARLSYVCATFKLVSFLGLKITGCDKSYVESSLTGSFSSVPKLVKLYRLLNEELNMNKRLTDLQTLRLQIEK